MAQGDFMRETMGAGLLGCASGKACGGRSWPVGIMSVLSPHSRSLALAPIGVHIVVPGPCEEGLLIGLKATGCLFL